MLIYQILWFNTILDPSWLQSHMALNLNGTAFTFSTGLAKNSRQGLVGWLTFSVKGNWLAGITWKAWPLIKREGNRGWAAKWFVLSIHVPVSLHYRVALASSSAQHSMGVFVTSCCTHCFLSWLKSTYFTFLGPFHPKLRCTAGGRTAAEEPVDKYLFNSCQPLSFIVGHCWDGQREKDSFMRQSDKTG